MRRIAPLAVLVLAAACSEASTERPASAAEPAAQAAPAPATPDSIPRPASPSADAASAATDTAGTVTHVLHPSLPPFRFAFVPSTEGEGGVRALRVHPADGAGEAVELPVSESFVPEHFASAERLLVGDLDFDGYADLGFVTMVAATGNATADYWRFDPAARRFVAVGTHPVFMVDSAGRSLRAHHKGGHAGLLFRRETYRWMDGKPVVVRVEAQDSNEQGEGYVHTVHELRDGRLTETARRALTREQAITEAERG